ncbi:MAG TPA: glycine oxidase ThiO, partial [Zetaproteobacteria bacterium]|nr:glycine oxidase ThiO [Zetaproteobacteria bacterium]
MVWPEVAQVRNPRLLAAVHAVLEKEQVEIIEQAEVSGLIDAAARVA